MPKYFSNIAISPKQDCIRVSANVENTKICMQGYDNGVKTAYEVGYNDRTHDFFNMPEFAEFTFSKQEFAVKKYSVYFLQNRTLKDTELVANKILFGSNINPTRTTGDLIIDGAINCHADEILLDPGTIMLPGSSINSISE